MPTRIYALAKDLKLDSKDLVEICKKAGISGKGSALASLTDEEVTKVKAYLQGPKKDASATTAGKTAPRAAAGATTPAAPIRREDALPGKTAGKIKVIGSSPKSTSKGTGNRAKSGETTSQRPAKRKPVIKVAPLPEAKTPPPPPKAAEPKAQKPEIRLPKDAIEGHRRGLKPALDEIAASALGKTAQKPWTEPGSTTTPSKTEPPKKRGRRGKGEKDDMAGMAGSRASRQSQRKQRARLRDDIEGDEDVTRGRRRHRQRSRTVSTAAPRKSKVKLELPCTVRTFSEAAGVSAAQVQRVLMGMGVMANINAQIEDEMVELIAAELGVELEFKQAESLEESVVQKILQQEDPPESLQPRPPVITFLGHVDHGKTSLLDSIIGTEVVKREAGGITQHIRAYQIEKDGQKLSFVDTPGHEAFTEMRARGAQVTDIAVLVVAADDGVMPQTEEAISHAKAAGVPIVVALNKIDIPGVDPNRVLAELSEHGLTPSQWGGDVEVVETSAITGQGIDELLETILAVAELHEFKANPDRPAVGTCLEAEQEAGRGVIAKLIVKNGTLRVGDVVVCGTTYGRIKALYDTLNPKRRLKECGPSQPVNATGFEEAPEAGEPFVVLDDISVARTVAAEREAQLRQRALSEITPRISFEDFQRRLAEGQLVSDDQEVVHLNLIIRADVRGSIEAIQKELQKLQHPQVRIKILQASVGGITVGDVTLAQASDAVIIGFNVIPDEGARALADEKGIEIRRYDVIYKVTDDIKAMLEGRLKPEEQQVELGQAIVKQVFHISRVGAVAGCYVVRGTIERGCRIRVFRDSRVIGDYELDSLRREKEDVKEVSRGMECGIKLSGFNDVKQDDVLEAYKIVEVARSL